MKLFALAVAAASMLWAAELKKETVAAFERYIVEADKQPFPAIRPKPGEVLTRPVAGEAIREVPSGLIHDWIGAVFIPETTLGQTLALIQDYDRHTQFYKPEVIASRTLKRDGRRFHIYLRWLKKKVITVVLSTEHDVLYEALDDKHWRSRSHTTRIAEVQNAGKANERELPPGTGHGFLWRLNSYWDFEEKDGGVYVACRAISLTRNVPTGFGWIIQPIIRDLPRESLVSTLRNTREALRGAAPPAGK